MECRNHFRFAIRLAFHLIVIVIALPTLASAQESNQASGKDNSQAQDSSKNQDNTNTSPASPLGPSWANSYIRQIGTSGLLAGNRVGVGWGSLYIPSAEVTGIVERFEGTSSVPASTFAATVLQTTVVYDHKLGNSRLAVQYQPSMAIAEGQVVSNFSNQNTTIDLLLYARPRWNVKFSDAFQYYYTQQSFGMPYMDANVINAGMITNGFLNGPGRWLSNNAEITVGYALSRRSSIEFTPNYMFTESGEGVNFQRGVSYGGYLNWNYQTSQRQTVGLQYIGQLIHETSGFTTDTLFHTIAGTIQRQVSATWFVNGSLGVTTSAQAQSGRQWSFYGAFGLVKSFGRSSLAISYSRGSTLASGLISSQYADRVDLNFRNQFTRRLSWGTGGGYLRQVQFGESSGWYALSDLQFLLAPRAGIFAAFDYYHTDQSISIGNLFSGSIDTYSIGLRWQPGRVPH